MDNDGDLYGDDDSGEEPTHNVTSQFLEPTHITARLEEDGALVYRTGYHYGHRGGFWHPGNLRFFFG